MAAIFAPVYRIDRRSEGVLAKQVRNRKRKRDQHDDPDQDYEKDFLPSDAQDPTALSTASYSRPLTRKDPFHIAGLSRESSLPPLPFPHAAVKSSSDSPRKSIQDQLAQLNPPLFLSSSACGQEDQPTSLRRRHLDNLTTILHCCMLKGDWERASNAWGLILRTETGGRGVDIRRNGRWSVGAEILMRRDQSKPRSDQTPSIEISDDGFRLAREYYDRLILQYPNTPRSRHNINSLVIYPALFNIWVYEIQARSKRRQRRCKLQQRQPIGSPDETVDDDDDDDEAPQKIKASNFQRASSAIRRQELEEALPLAQRMDELLQGPPYETSGPLTEMRGMVALWIADLHAEMHDPVQQRYEDHSDSDISSPRQEVKPEVAQPSKAESGERAKARQMFERAVAAGIKLPSAVESYTRSKRE